MVRLRLLAFGVAGERLGGEAEVLAETGWGTPLRRIGIPDEYSLLGPPDELYRYYGIDAEGIAQTVRHYLS